VDAIYATNPTPFDEGFAVFKGTEPPTLFVLLVPIAASEATLIAEKGWDWFESALESQNPDIWDLNRTERVKA